MRLKKLKQRHKLLTVSMIVVAIILLTFLSYYVVHGFSAKDLFFNEYESVKLIIYEPDEGQKYYDGDSIIISGSMWGGIPKTVYVWDERFNIPINCYITASAFGVELYASDLSEGTHTLCFQGQASDGRWTSVVKKTITKLGDTDANIIYPNQGNTFVETYFPEPLAIIFRPVEEVLTQTIVLITGGTSDDDLNGDNIPDEVQQSPVSPRYNPMNVPLSAIIVYGLIIAVVVIILLSIVKPYMQRRQEMQSRPAYQQFQLRMKALRNEKLRAELSKEKTERKLLEKKLKEEQKQTKKPINIYLSEKTRQAKLKMPPEKAGQRPIQRSESKLTKRERMKGFLKRTAGGW